MGWAVAAGSTFTGLQDASNAMRICIARASVRRVHDLRDATQSGDTEAFTTPASTTVTGLVMRASKRYTYAVEGWGWHQTSSDSFVSNLSDVYSSGNMASLANSPIASVQSIIVDRTLDLEDVTDSGDAVPNKAFVIKKSTYRVSLLGNLEDNETILDNDLHTSPPSLTIPLGTGTLAGSLITQEVSPAVNFQAGGPNAVAVSGFLSGTVTKTTTPFSIVQWTGSLNLNNGHTLSGAFLMPSLRTDVNYRDAHKVAYQFSAILTGTATFA